MELLSRCPPPGFQPANEKPAALAQLQRGLHQSLIISSKGDPDGRLFATWSAGVGLLLRVATCQPGREEVSHVSLMEAGFWAVDELTRGQEVGLPLHIRAPG